MQTRVRWFLCACALAMLGVLYGRVRASTTVQLPPAAGRKAAGDKSTAFLKLAPVTYRITGPYSHENLSVYLLHSRTQDDRDFMTLDEGLKTKQVRITEKEQEDVGELLISNSSHRPLFLQEGDRLKGGKQDRTLYASLVIPPKAMKVPVPTFCIEPTRWTEGE